MADYQSFKEEFDGLSEHNRQSVTLHGGADTFYFYNRGTIEFSKRVYRTWPYTQPDMAILTKSHETVDILKTFGLARGNTPSSTCIGLLGDYLRQQVSNSGLSKLSPTSRMKVHSVREAQRQLAALEESEVELVAGDYKGQEALRSKLLKIIDSLDRENDKISFSFFHAEGRLGRKISSIRRHIENYEFPASSFSPADQLRFDKDEDQEYFFKLSDHGAEPHDFVAFFQNLYRHQEREMSVPMHNPFRRSFDKLLYSLNAKRTNYPLEKSTNEDLKKLYQAHQKFHSRLGTRMIGGIGRVLTGFPVAIINGTYLGFRYLWEQAKDFKNCHVDQATSDIQKKALLDIFEKELERINKVLSVENKTDFNATNLLESNPPVDVRADQDPVSYDHDTLFSNALLPIKNMLEGHQDKILDNPTIFACLASLGIAPVASLVIPFDVISMIKLAGGKHVAGQIFLERASLLGTAAHGGASTVHTYASHRTTAAARVISEIGERLNNVGAVSLTTGVMCSPSMQEYFDKLSKTLSDPITAADFGLTIAMVGIRAEGSQLSMLSRNRPFRLSLVCYDKMVVAHGLYPNLTKLISSVIRFPLKFITTPVRIMSGGILSMIRGSLDPLRKELSEAAFQIEEGAHIAIRGFLSGTQFSWRLLNYIPKLAIELLMSVPARLLGTLGDAAESIGKSLLSVYDSIAKRSFVGAVISFLFLKVPGELFKGIGQGLILASKGLKMARSYTRHALDREIFRPGMRALSYLNNTANILLSPHHPLNVIFSKLTAIKKAIQLLDPQLPEDEVKREMLIATSTSLISYQNYLQESDPKERKKLSAELQSNMDRSLSEISAHSVRCLMASCKKTEPCLQSVDIEKIIQAGVSNSLPSETIKTHSSEGSLYHLKASKAVLDALEDSSPSDSDPKPSRPHLD